MFGKRSASLPFPFGRFAMLNTTTPAPGLKSQFHILISSGFYFGYIKYASGTWGTLVGVLLYWPCASLNRMPSAGGMPWLYVLIVLALCAVGTWTAHEAEKLYGVKDPGKIVIDEIAGFFVTMFLVPWTWYWVLSAFIVFRVFDVVKPGIIRKLQYLKGGVGIMIDDILAGALGCFVLHAVRLIVIAIQSI